MAKSPPSRLHRHIGLKYALFIYVFFQHSHPPFYTALAKTRASPGQVLSTKIRVSQSRTKANGSGVGWLADAVRNRYSWRHIRF